MNLKVGDLIFLYRFKMRTRSVQFNTIVRHIDIEYVLRLYPYDSIKDSLALVIKVIPYYELFGAGSSEADNCYILQFTTLADERYAYKNELQGCIV